jgi:hypothetical protein
MEIPKIIMPVFQKMKHPCHSHDKNGDRSFIRQLKEERAKKPDQDKFQSVTDIKMGSTGPIIVIHKFFHCSTG